MLPASQETLHSATTFVHHTYNHITKTLKAQVCFYTAAQVHLFMHKPETINPHK